MNKVKIILAAIIGLLSVGAVSAFKVARFCPNGIYYFTSEGRCVTIPYTINQECTGTFFTVTTKGYYTMKVNNTSCTHSLPTPFVLRHTSED